MMSWVLSAASVLLVASRYVARLHPLWERIPARWRWVPPALVAAGGAVAQALPNIQGASVPALDILVVVALAASAGAHGPDQPAPPTTPSGQAPLDGGRALPLLLVVMASCLAPGCAGSFEEARASGRGGLLGASQEDRAWCRRLDSRRASWAALGAGAGVLAGAQGLATVPAEGDEFRVGLALGSAAAAAVAAAAYAVAERAGDSWARECSR